MSKHWIHKPSEVPTQPHFAIFEANSIHVPGDERSRQYPGHGYPASTEYFLSYIAFDTKEEWEADIQERSSRKNGDAFIAVHIIPAKIETKIVVSVSTPEAQPHKQTLMCPTCGTQAVSVYRDGKSTRESRNGHKWLPAQDKQ